MCIRDRIEAVQRQQHGKAEQCHGTRQPVGLGVFERFDAVIDLDRNDAGLVGDVAADHQHDAEFANRVRKAKDRAAYETLSLIHIWVCIRDRRMLVCCCGFSARLTSRAWTRQRSTVPTGSGRREI